MESPGEYLKREREIRKVPLSKIFECTRVPMKYLEALEADDLARLPHQTFVKGYIKSYCKCLGLDETDAVLRYELFLKEQGAAREEEAVVPERQEAKKPLLVFAPSIKDELKRESLPFLRSYGNIIALAAAGVAAVAVIYVATTRRHSAPPAVVTQAESPVAAAPEGSAQQVAPSSPAGAPVTPARPSVPATPPVEPAKTVMPAAKTVAPPQAAPAALATAPMTKTVTPAPAKTAPAAAAEKKEAPAVTGHLLVARASEMTWIKLKIDNGEPFDVVLRAGEKIAWKAEKGYDIVVGNAGGVALSLDGKEVAGLGKAGEVVKLTLPAGAPALKAKGAVKPAKATADTVSPAGTISGSTAARPATKKASPAVARPESPDTQDTPAAESADAVKPKAVEAPRWESTPKNRFEVRPADDIQ